MIFDEESTSDAQKFLGPPKRKILERKIGANFLEKKSPEFFCWASKNEMSWIVWNTFSQSFTQIGALFEG